jgi:hypothetical protein
MDCGDAIRASRYRMIESGGVVAYGAVLPETE